MRAKVFCRFDDNSNTTNLLFIYIDTKRLTAEQLLNRLEKVTYHL